MKTNYQILALIPARGGSKGVKRKNILPLNGKPLIAWTIETALNCSAVNRVLVSTEDLEIAKIAQEYGAEVPFIRPEALAQDDTPDLPVYQQACSWLAEKEDYQPDIIVWLRPTSPLRTIEDIEKAIAILATTKANSVRSVCAVEHHPYWMKRVAEDNYLVPFIEGKDEKTYYRRQLLPTAYRLNGAVDLTWCKTVLEKSQLYFGDMQGYIMPPERSIDIDTELDFAIAEILLGRKA